MYTGYLLPRLLMPKLEREVHIRVQYAMSLLVEIEEYINLVIAPPFFSCGT